MPRTSEHIVDPTGLASLITGCEKSDKFEGCSNSHGHHAVFGWTMPFLNNASELIRYALAEAWAEGNI